MDENLKIRLKTSFKGELFNDDKTLDLYSRDASLFQIKPALAAFPIDAEDVKKLVQYVHSHPEEHLSLTARSGGTDMTGGPLTESIVVDFNKHLNSLKKLEKDSVTVEPGMFYRDLETTLAPHNLLMPSYPASKAICTVGGMVSNNSGGEKTLSFGQTNHYVSRLKVVLSDGNEYTFSPLTKSELEAKMKQQDFEGDIYRKMFHLIDTNYDLIQAAKPNVSKNSTGYLLWNVWDKQRFDLTQLFCGSQGTLGLISEITFRLIKPKPHGKMLVIFLHNLEHLGDLVKTTLNYAPESFESYDDHTLKFALKYLPDIIKRLHISSIFTLAWEFIPEVRMLLTGGIPKLVLLAEFTGNDAQEVEGRAQAAQTALKQYHVKTRLITTVHEEEKYWVIRRESFNLLRHHVHGKRTAPFIDDIIVRPQYLPEFLPKLDAILSQYDIIYTIAGHIGDGNFHIIPLMDLTKPDKRAIIHELAEKVYSLVLEYKGSISGEHNDGLIRSFYLQKMYGEKLYSLFEETKKIFDPQNIFNPHKKVNASWDYAKQFLSEQ